VATNAKIVGIVLGTLALYTLIANKIPQCSPRCQAGAHPPARTSHRAARGGAGRKVFQRDRRPARRATAWARARPQPAHDEKGPGTAIGARCGKARVRKKLQAIPLRIARPNRACTSWQAISRSCPVMTKQLSPEQVWAVIAFPNPRAARWTVTASDIHRPPQPPQPPLRVVAAGGGAVFAGGVHRSEGHHPGGGVPRLPQARRAGPGDRARSHARRRAAQRGVDPQEDLDPASSVTKGYEKLAGIMPKSFGTLMNAAQSEALAQYLAAHK